MAGEDVDTAPPLSPVKFHVEGCAQPQPDTMPIHIDVAATVSKREAAEALVALGSPISSEPQLGHSDGRGVKSVSNRRMLRRYFIETLNEGTATRVEARRLRAIRTAARRDGTFCSSEVHKSYRLTMGRTHAYNLLQLGLGMANMGQRLWQYHEGFGSEEEHALFRRHFKSYANGTLVELDSHIRPALLCGLMEE